MRYISEQSLRDLITKYKDMKDPSKGISTNQMCDQTIDALRMVLNECQELDEILVSMLRPMREAPKNGNYIKAYLVNPIDYTNEKFIRWNKRFNGWEEYMVEPQDKWDVHFDKMFKGWIAIPEFKPEQI